MAEVTTEPMKEMPKAKVNKVLLITLVTLLAAALTGAGVWYYMDQKAQNEKKSDENQTTGTNTPPTEEKTGTVDETANWKTYTDHEQRFTVKYPSDWSFQEDIVSGSDRSLNSNVFATDNVIFYDSLKKMVFGYNMGEVLGRGGTCTKREVMYTPTVTGTKKLTISKKVDTSKAVSDTEYCGMGEELFGYQTTIEQFTVTGTEYFIHSESTQVSDADAAKAIEIFEKMAATMTFK